MEAIALSNDEFEGENNVYMLESDGEVALVDTGTAVPDVRSQLEGGLAALGHDLADVTMIALTHWHPDHAALAGTIQDSSGATVYAHEADAPLVERVPDAERAKRERQLELFEEWGVPPDERAEVIEALDAGLDVSGDGASVTPIRDDEVLRFGECALRVFHAPGHTAGLCCFEFSRDGCREAFVGDAILPEYTPNVCGADIRVERPLQTYIETLYRLADRNLAVAWPGHRDAIERPRERITEIIAHHRERTQQVVEAVRAAEPADAWTVSERLFGDLSGIHILHGPGESYAHLDHLQRHGVLDRTEEGYVLVDHDPDVASLF